MEWKETKRNERLSTQSELKKKRKTEEEEETETNRNRIAAVQTAEATKHNGIR